MKPIQQLHDFKNKVDRKLGRFLDQKLKESQKIDPSLQKLVGAIRGIVIGNGKRLRPAFFYFGYKACGGKKEKAILYTSQAVEFLHTMALIHDDIIDRSPLRRGQPTVHQLLGDPGAILAGDLSFAFADEIFTNSPFESQLIRKAQKYFDLLKREVIYGEYLDVLVPAKKKIDEKRIIKILEYKSGKYTVERPLHLGAALAQASSSAFKAFSDYGIPAGVAFQIQDDILSMFGQEGKTGKPIDSDLKEGKKTLLVAKTLEKLKGSQKTKFAQILGNKSLTRKDFLWAKDKIKEAGALAYSQGLAKKLVQEGKRALDSYPFQKEGKDFLMGMADYIIERER